MLDTIFNIVTALSTFAMTIIAWFALHTWRKEFIGKKKIELAAEIMDTVFRFQDVLMNARIAISTPQEINEIKEWLEEVNFRKQNVLNSIPWSIYSDRMHYLTPVHRLNKNSETIDKFGAILNKSFFYWDENLYKLLHELHSFLGKIRYASEMLYENPNAKEFFDIAFANEKATDEMSKRIFGIGDEIKLNLELVYKDKQTKWKKLITKK